jgi:phenolic acid decarboxylase
VESVVVDLLKVCLLGRALRVMLVGRVSRPATRIGVEFAHEESAAATSPIMPKYVEDPATSVCFHRANIDALHFFRRDAEGRE